MKTRYLMITSALAGGLFSTVSNATVPVPASDTLTVELATAGSSTTTQLFTGSIYDVNGVDAPNYILYAPGTELASSKTINSGKFAYAVGLTETTGNQTYLSDLVIHVADGTKEYVGLISASSNNAYTADGTGVNNALTDFFKANAVFGWTSSTTLTSFLTQFGGQSAAVAAYTAETGTLQNLTSLLYPSGLTIPAGTQYAKISAVSAVPVPGAVWLFSSVMAGLVGLNRRKRK